jgi:hypothetical protein
VAIPEFDMLFIFTISFKLGFVLFLGPAARIAKGSSFSGPSGITIILNEYKDFLGSGLSSIMEKETSKTPQSVRLFYGLIL